jgi:hypothetical protein
MAPVPELVVVINIDLKMEIVQKITWRSRGSAAKRNRGW